MEDKINPKLRGEITLALNGKQVFKESNTITDDALEILVRGLANVPNTYCIDKVKFEGSDFSPVEKTISNTLIEPSENSITFITTAMEEDFSGTVTDLELKMSGINKALAKKTGLSILKNDATRLEVRWQIIISNCI